MKTTCLFLLMFLGFHMLSYCQGAYQKAYDLNGTVELLGGATGFDKGVIGTGSLQTSYAHISAFLLKLDSLGNSQWAKKYGDTGSGLTAAYFVCPVNDGGYLFGGQTNNLVAGATGFQFFAIKADDTGAVQWAKVYGGMAYGSCNAATQTADGGYVFTGGVAGAFGGSDIYLVKTDGQGEILWTKVYGTSTIESAKYIHETSDGGLIIAGYIGNMTDFLLMKTDSSGNILWANAYGTAAYDELWCALATTDGGYLLAGTTENSHAGISDSYLVKVDSSGLVQWSEQLSGQWQYGNDIVLSLANTGTGNYLLTGAMEDVSNDYVTLFKIDVNGNIVMSTALGGQSFAMAGNYVQQLVDGGSIILGYRGRGTAAFPIKAYAIKSDSTGASGCNTQNPNFNVINPATVTSPLMLNVSSLDSSQDVFPFITTLIPVDSLLCAPDAVTEVPAQPNYSIYPNPTDGIFTVLSDEELSELVITNSFGEVVSKTTVQSKAVIDLRGQARGVYFYTLSGKEGIRRGKIVLQ